MCQSSNHMLCFVGAARRASGETGCGAVRARAREVLGDVKELRLIVPEVAGPSEKKLPIRRRDRQRGSDRWVVGSQAGIGAASSSSS